jgi:hypothetical protein
MFIYKASKIAAQMLILLINITLAMLDRYCYSSVIESSLSLIEKE